MDEDKTMKSIHKLLGNLSFLVVMLMVTILIVSGVQLLALGMLGEYLGRVLLTINSKPQFVIEEETGFDDS